MENEAKQWDIKPYQKEVLRIFRVFERICEKHGWRYYADGGTALGAIRHKGFIPWDDDFDIAMPREDFNEFVKVVKNELPTGLEFQRGGIRGPIYYAQIFNVQDRVLDWLSAATNIQLTIPPFMDIFVLDGVPENVLDFGKWWRLRMALRLVQIYRFPDSYSYVSAGCKFYLKKMAYRAIGAILSPFYPQTKDNDEFMLLYDNLAMRWPFGNSSKVVEPAFFKMRTKRIADRYYWGEARVVPFEDGTIKIPQYAECLCRMNYGDYMTLPPPECRIPEHCFHRAWNHV